MKNRMREIRTSGSVRDGDGNVPIYSADKQAIEIIREVNFFWEVLKTWG